MAEADPFAEAESLPFDAPGRSHPASTGNPTPARTEKATKDRRDGVVEGTLSERKNTETTRTPRKSQQSFLIRDDHL